MEGGKVLGSPPSCDAMTGEIAWACDANPVWGTRVPGELMPVVPVSLSTIWLLRRWRPMTRCGMVPGCCLPDAEEHSTWWVHHRWTEGALCVRIWPWCLIPKRGWWSIVPNDFGNEMMRGFSVPTPVWICAWIDATVLPVQIGCWCWGEVFWEDLFLDGRIGKWMESWDVVAIPGWAPARDSESLIGLCRLGLVPKRTDCHVLASIVVQAQRGQVVHWWVGDISLNDCTLGPARCA